MDGSHWPALLTEGRKSKVAVLKIPFISLPTMKSLFVFLLLCLALGTLPRAVHSRKPFMCIQCDDCSHDNYAPKECPPWASGCVTLRVSRTEVKRDCYTQELAEQVGCTIGHMANRTCAFCNDSPGCNSDHQDALVCRSCDWNTEGFCAVQRVCRAPFNTEMPMCYVLFLYPLGFHFGCVDEMSAGVEQLMKQDDQRLHYHWCDSNDCNAYAKDFWPFWQQLLDPFRICHVCFGNSTFCGPKACDPHGIYRNFCLRRLDFGHSLCLNELSNMLLARYRHMGIDLICGTDNCNKEVPKELYRCLRDSSGGKEAVYSARDGCSLYLSECGPRASAGECVTAIHGSLFSARQNSRGPGTYLEHTLSGRKAVLRVSLGGLPEPGPE